MSDAGSWVFTDTTTVDWETVYTGQQIKRIGELEGTGMILSRVPPGFVGPPHVHDGLEYLYVIDGSVVSNGRTLTAGSAYIAGSGTDHPEFRSPNGATFVVVFTFPRAAEG